MGCAFLLFGLFGGVLLHALLGVLLGSLGSSSGLLSSRSGASGRGDLLIRARIRPHPYFRREDNDIVLDVPVTVREAFVAGSYGILKLVLRSEDYTWEFQPVGGSPIDFGSDKCR